MRQRHPARNGEFQVGTQVLDVHRPRDPQRFAVSVITALNTAPSKNAISTVAQA